MKTKLTLLTVLVAALFVGGCASTQPQKPVVTDTEIIKGTDGRWCLKDSNNPFTGTVLKMDKRPEAEPGMVYQEYQLKDGLHHGYWKVGYFKGMSGDIFPNGVTALYKYDEGRIVFSKGWSRDGIQEERGGFNADGSPKQDREEYPDKLRQPVVFDTHIEKKKDGRTYLKGSDTPFTGTVRWIDKRPDRWAGLVSREWQVKDGLWDGYWKAMDGVVLYAGVVVLAKYVKGEKIFEKRWTRDGNPEPVKGFNVDGSPASP